jgi:hypothetical protein
MLRYVMSLCVKRAEGRAGERLFPGPDRLHSGCLLPFVHPSYDRTMMRGRGGRQRSWTERERSRWSKVTERTGETSVQDRERAGGSREIGYP